MFHKDLEKMKANFAAAMGRDHQSLRKFNCLGDQTIPGLLQKECFLGVSKNPESELTLCLYC